MPTPLIRFGLILITVLLLIGTAGPGSAQDPPPSEKVLAFAQSLFEEGDLHRAETEAKRYLFLYSDQAGAEAARKLLADIQAAREDLPPRASDAFVPWEDRLGGRDDSTGRSGGAFLGLVHFYQDHLRTFRKPGDTCPSYPSCSEYAVQAMEKHGGLMGTFIFVDRYFREATTARTPPLIRTEAGLLHFDPLEKNDYWLTRSVEDQ